MIRVLIVDDHSIVAAGLRSLLEGDPAINVIATVGTKAEGLKLAHLLQPNVLLLDLRLPDSDGPQLVADFRQACADAKIVVLTGYGDSQRDDALRFGADEYLTKELASEHILESVRGSGGVHSSPWDDLTDRERETCRLVAAGMSNIEIAAALKLSQNTVKTHLAHAMAKAGVRNRTELAQIVRDH